MFLKISAPPKKALKTGQLPTSGPSNMAACPDITFNLKMKPTQKNLKASEQNPNVSYLELSYLWIFM